MHSRPKMALSIIQKPLACSEATAAECLLPDAMFVVLSTSCLNSASLTPSYLHDLFVNMHDKNSHLQQLLHTSDIPLLISTKQDGLSSTLTEPRPLKYIEDVIVILI